MRERITILIGAAMVGASVIATAIIGTDLLLMARLQAAAITLLIGYLIVKEISRS